MIMSMTGGLWQRGRKVKPKRKRLFQISYHENVFLFPKLKEEWKERVTNTDFKFWSF